MLLCRASVRAGLWSGSGLSSGMTEGCSGRDVVGKPPPNMSGTAAVPGPGSAGSRLRPITS
eukprot:623068-Prymnesium_polylepis.1